MRALLHMVRLAALLMALAGAGAYVLWNAYPESVDSLNGHVVYRYKKAVDRQLETVAALAKVDPEKAAIELADLTDELSRYRKLDLHFPRWRKAALLEASVLTGLGNHDGAAETLARFAKQDPRDLEVALEVAEVLVESGDPELVRRGRERLQMLFDQLPTVPSIARDHISQLAQQGETAAISDALSRHLSMTVRPQHAMQHLERDWRIFWSPTEAFTAQSKSTVIAVAKGKRLSVPVSLPAGQVYLRVDFPRFCMLELGRPRLVVTTGSGEARIEDLRVVSKIGIEVHEGDLSIAGEVRSRVVFQLPESLTSELFEGHLVMDLTSLPRWMLSHMGGPAGKSLQRTLARAEEWDRLSMVRNAWMESHLARPVIMNVDGVKRTYALSVVDSALSYTCDGSFETPVDRVQVVFPAEVGDVLVLDELSVATEAGTHTWDVLKPQAGFEWVGVEWSGVRCTVIDDNPSVSWAPDRDGSLARRVIVRGTIH